jgi:hypothetical protein
LKKPQNLVFKGFLMIGYCGIGSFIVAGSSLLHFLLATGSHPTVIDLYWNLFTQSSGTA